MISIKYIPNGEVQRHSCDNCNRETPFVLKYRFCNDKGVEFNRLTLCEDCSGALPYLHRKCMELGEPFKYDKDEIVKEEI